MTTDDLAGLLAEHRFSFAMHGCICRQWTFSVAGNPSTFEVLAHQEDHVAAVIAAAGWRKVPRWDPDGGIQGSLEVEGQ